MDTKELIGVTLGTCTLERVVGRGGMGAVFMAQQARPVRTVAVKVLIPPAGSEEDQEGVFLARFQREADTVAKLEHKNILPIYEYDEAIVDQEHLRSEERRVGKECRYDRAPYSKKKKR